MTHSFSHPTLRVSAETNADFTAEPGVCHIVTATTTDVVGTLPAAAEWAGLFIGFDADTLTSPYRLVIEPDGSETIEGEDELLAVSNGEALMLYSDGTDIHNITFQRRPVSGRVTREAAQSINTSTFTFIQFDTVKFNRGACAFSNAFAITGVSTGSNTFTIAGDQSEYFPIGRRFKVRDSTGNDGYYQTTGVSVSGSTTITVASVTDSTADGTITIQGMHATRKGTYWLRGGGYLAGIDDNELLQVNIYINGVSNLVTFFYSPGTNLDLKPTDFDIFNLEQWDFVELSMWHNEGSTQNTSASAESYQPSLTITEI